MMSPDTGDRLAAAVETLAREVFGSRAEGWLDTPNATLAGKRPADLSRDRLGAQMVLSVLRRMGN
jgi:uncharacterized protein (DUF2384 family)